jgi:class 3 adenylate cyclase
VEESTDRQPGRILVVDDNSMNRVMLARRLEGEGHAVSLAAHGREALELLHAQAFDLVLLDIVMPEMDGFEACRQLKADPDLADIPVIFLTASNDAESVVRGFELGAVDYITKPFYAAELLSRVRTHLQLRAARLKLADLADKLSRYLPPPVYASIFAGEREARVETHRRPLTIFFSDIVGFTARTEATPDQELVPWLNGYLDAMARIALRHGGTLDKFIGDAVMVFFGDPQTDGPEADALRCVAMALEMQSAARERGVNIRMGINSGECTVGNFGSEQQMNYTIIGKAVNMASRLQGRSEPGRILIGEATHRLIGRAVRCEPRGPLELKGIATPVMAYWVGSASA